MQEDRKARKKKNLLEAGLLNPEPDRIQDSLFQDCSEFFDPEDNLQIRYEMLRAHLVKHNRVSAICKRFGVSRQTFYNLQDKFERKGTAGLLPQQPGPKGPSKLTEEVLSFVGQHLEADEPIATPRLLAKVQEKFSISLHRRTLEKIKKDLLSKKNA